MEVESWKWLSDGGRIIEMDGRKRLTGVLDITVVKGEGEEEGEEDDVDVDGEDVPHCIVLSIWIVTSRRMIQ